MIVGRAKTGAVLKCLRHHRPVVIFCTLLCVVWAPSAFGAGWQEIWVTRDQRGWGLFEEGRYLEAAEVFEDSMLRGAAYYRGGDFESSAVVFGRIPTPEAAYNRGNALVMLGQYEEAIRSYGRALEARAGWREAEENRAIAAARLAALAPPDSDAGGTGGKLEADEIVFDDTGRVEKSGSEAETDGGEALSDDEMRAVWLRRIQNEPAQFLRARFAYQLYRSQQEGADEPESP